jgi:membrane-bound ClpP family serine protease
MIPNSPRAVQPLNLQPIVLPLLVLGMLLVIVGLFNASFASVAEGVLALLASAAVQFQGRPESQRVESTQDQARFVS